MQFVLCEMKKKENNKLFEFKKIAYANKNVILNERNTYIEKKIMERRKLFSNHKKITHLKPEAFSILN